MAEMHKPSGRTTPGQTYPTESGTPHPEPPPTESPMKVIVCPRYFFLIAFALGTAGAFVAAAAFAALA